ncbi:MAG: sensor histidine kinase [Candidatus Dormibacteraeota bacterium]|nr:sensor histidine kinase [Candidatus Dormibacteraeota bacterium]MBV9525913.1 sensor histidine kinase [Candidatus Dormibacteraeota bacterium]
MRPAAAPSSRERAFASRRLRLVWFAVWLLFLIYPVTDIVNNHYAAWRAALAAIWLAAFVFVYLRTMWTALNRDPRRPQLRSAVGLAVLYAMTIPITVIFGGNWVGGIIYLAVATGAVLPDLLAYAAILGLAGLQVAVVWVDRLDVAANWDLYLLTVGLGVMMVFWRRMLGLFADLREAREEVARLAVSDERLRIARDLHDVLGHSLSVIALKAQVARRTMDNDPGEARASLADVEEVTHASLREVREMVAGYREQSLSGELRGAAEVLGAAGIALDVRQEAGSLPRDVDGALAWAVREGVSNVLRHSHAQRCWITIVPAGGGVRFELRDDGAGANGAVDTRNGNGIRGLRERMAQVGGTLDAEADREGGFRLSATVPAAR